MWHMLSAASVALWCFISWHVNVTLIFGLCVALALYFWFWNFCCNVCPLSEGQKEHLGQEIVLKLQELFKLFSQ